MRKIVFSLLFIIIGLVSVFSQEEEVEIIPATSKNYIFQLGLGPAYSFYFFDAQTVIDSMDEGSLVRIPFSIDFLFGQRMSDTMSWRVSLNSFLDSFFDSSDSFQLYTILLSAGFQYNPFRNGFTLGMGLGGSILIPSTTLSYIGSTEFGSNISINMEYFFDTLKFSSLDLIPGLVIKYVHSEMKRGSVDQLSLCMALKIR